jgi:tellurite resistance protein TerC
MASIWFWVGFTAFLLGMLALDLGVFHRRAHEISIREAAIWTVVWVTISLLFNGAVYLYAGSTPALEFLTGYLIEKSLSVDNIFVMATIFSYFSVPSKYQHRVLFWGILGALALRGLFIGMGAYVLEHWHWVMYVFGALLVITAINMALREEKPFDGERSRIARMARRIMPFTAHYDGQKFWTVENGRRVATPLMLVLVMVEFTDVIFAIDSIPAIFAITDDPFLVFTSNAFAILGLRSMYFLLAGIVHRFHYLRLGLSAVLMFVGVKMLLKDVYVIPTVWSLLAIATILTVSIVASWRRLARQQANEVLAESPDTSPHTPHPFRPSERRSPRGRERRGV